MASGLVLVTGPLSLQARAQDYVDVEAERAGRTTSAATAPATPAPADPYARPARDPYSVQPAQAYPATSYGVNSAPAGPAVGATPGAPASSGANQSVGNLFLQVQQLQQEVMRLNGLVEEQANELRKLKDQSLERYVDLDKRLSAVSGGAAAAAPGGETSVVKAAPAGNVSMGGGTELPGEAQAYQAAYGLVRNQKFDAAIDAFRQFLGSYPDGKYAPNAHYWLGELYLVIEPQDLESSRQAFSLLLSEYPDNPKAADAIYKLGKVQFLKGNRKKAREYMDQVVRDYSNSSAAGLARTFIDENY